MHLATGRPMLAGNKYLKRHNNALNKGSDDIMGCGEGIPGKGQ